MSSAKLDIEFTSLEGRLIQTSSFKDTPRVGEKLAVQVRGEYKTVLLTRVCTVGTVVYVDGVEVRDNTDLSESPPSFSFSNDTQLECMRLAENSPKGPFTLKERVSCGTYETWCIYKDDVLLAEVEGKDFARFICIARDLFLAQQNCILALSEI
jgi:hypothetical protein